MALRELIQRAEDVDADAIIDVNPRRKGLSRHDADQSRRRSAASAKIGFRCHADLQALKRALPANRGSAMGTFAAFLDIAYGISGPAPASSPGSSATSPSTCSAPPARCSARHSSSAPAALHQP
jgi:hypothetical protein